MRPRSFRGLLLLGALLVLFVAAGYAGLPTLAPAPRPAAARPGPGADPGLVPLSLDDLTAEADEIVTGIVLERTPTRLGSGRTIVTRVRLHVTNRIKGDGADELTLIVPGGELPDGGMYVSNQPNYRVGEQALAFLRRGRLGEFETVGFSQGKMRVVNGRIPERGTDLVSFVGEIRAASARRGQPLPERSIQNVTPDTPAASPTPAVAARPFVPAEYKWQSAQMPIPWLFNPSGVPFDAGTMQSQLAAGFQAWTSLANVRTSYLGTTTLLPDGTAYEDWDYVPDDVNVVGFLPGLPAGVLGLTVCFYNPNTGVAQDCDITFSPSFVWSATPAPGTYDFQSVATHEIGHFLGLNHSWEPSYGGSPTPLQLQAVMYWQISAGTVKRVPNSDDTAGIQFLYGPPAGPPTATATPTKAPVLSATPSRTPSPTYTPSPTRTPRPVCSAPAPNGTVTPSGMPTATYRLFLPIAGCHP